MRPETPVTDGEHVYAYFGMHGVYCYDLKGKQVWKKDLGSYSMMAGWGTPVRQSSSTIGHIILCDNEEVVHRRTQQEGRQEVWHTAHREDNVGHADCLKNKQRTEVVAIGKVRSYRSGRRQAALGIEHRRRAVLGVADRG
jgi:hypothetical protein